jgi:DNA-binding CsgD family transcriptional regulator
MGVTDALSRGRAAFERHAWSAAYADLVNADRDEALGVDDLPCLAIAAYMSGHDAAADDAWTRAHEEYLRRGDPVKAVRCAFWLGMMLVSRNEYARGGGWLARARRIFDESRADSVERGYLLVPGALQALEHDPSVAYSAFAQAGEIADRFHDSDLAAMSRLGRGQALTSLGEIDEGVELFDEAMVSVTAGEVTPVVAGIIYCAVIEWCHFTFDLGRAREWTSALRRWCAENPDMVPYRGLCLAHHAEILRLGGAWDDAGAEAARGCERMSEPTFSPAVGAAQYQSAELHRLRGEFDEAEALYLESGSFGREPQPGLALVWAARGRYDAALAAVRRVLDDAPWPTARPTVLAANVDIALEAGDVAAARTAVDELTTISAGRSARLVRAMTAHARGSVLLAEGDPSSAHAELRRAVTTWQQLGMPYDAARTRVLLGRACRDLGDEESARMEFDAARRVFADLGAVPDEARAARLLLRTGAGPDRHGLTEREVQVLRLIASGKSNRAIAADLVVSEKTVARHVSNIFTKLDLPSRSAATAFAYEHHLAG